MFFASDNTSPVHPKVMEALSKANSGYMPSYGNDPIMDSLRTKIRDLFDAPEAAVYLVATGSAANALSLSILNASYQTVFCHRNAHIEEDECGAPEFYMNGGKLALVDGDHAKMTPDTLRAVISATGCGGVHGMQRGAVSITNVTEQGAVYSAAEVAALTAVAREYGLPCHMDGARFANAIAASGATPAEMTWQAGIDVLSFGGTKNGLMGCEAVIIFDPKRAWEFELRRKRGGHLFSKHRYLSAQMDAFVTDGLWIDLATHANAVGAELARGLSQIDGVTLAHPADANMVFASMPCAMHRHGLTHGAHYYPWPDTANFDGDGTAVGRFVTSWSTTMGDVQAFLTIIAR